MSIENHMHEHVAEIAYWIKHNWYWLAGAFIGLFYALRWSVVQYMKRHPTHDEMSECKEDIATRLKRVVMEHEQAEWERQDADKAENVEAHSRLFHLLERLEDKIMKLTEQVMENMRVRK